MIPKVGEKYLITTSNWFFAPDGESYRAVYGTIQGIYSDETTLGIKTNDKSTNWYVVIGNMIVAGCQIYYAIRTEFVNFDPPNREIEFGGRLVVEKQPSTRIYNADK